MADSPIPDVLTLIDRLLADEKTGKLHLRQLRKDLVAFNRHLETQQPASVDIVTIQDPTSTGRDKALIASAKCVKWTERVLQQLAAQQVVTAINTEMLDAFVDARRALKAEGVEAVGESPFAPLRVANRRTP